MEHNQDWLNLSLDCADEHELEIVEEALFFAGALSVSYEAVDDEEIFEPPVGTTPLWQNTRITALFEKNANLGEILAQLDEMLGEKLRFNSKFFQDIEWTRAWLDYFKPIEFVGKQKRLWVGATEHEIKDNQGVILRLDPGLAFGTGTHPSTAMCLQFLADTDLNGKALYDYGCGSGILGIAAGLLGAKEIYQTDIDPQALTASLDNAQKNKVEHKIKILQNPDDAPQVDILVANILLEPLCFLKSQFEKHLKDHTVLVFAGILERQQARIEEVYGEQFHIERINERDEWICLKLSKK
ncbi:MAG: 50S ribosomal protein L11 methyltransferase [Cardiobacteriaceae bacterium]|nr:50S ribosomal protein L11 methyltransferase [Cardiobacteriaceae bacterium]